MSVAGEKNYDVLSSWKLFNLIEKKNIFIYIAGIIFYKFGIEAFNGAFIALATNRYDDLAKHNDSTPHTFQRIGLLQGLNQGFQCMGSIVIAPLIKRYPTRVVLSFAIFVFGLFSAIILIVDAGTGGHIKPDGADPNDFSYYGSYNTDGMIPIYCVTGITYGMVELIRRVIPRDIVGGNVQKLQRMDALVHIFYEIAGTSGALCTALALIPALGNNMAFIITPLLFTLAAIIWWFISDLEHPSTRVDAIELEQVDGNPNRNYFMKILVGFKNYFSTIWIGGKILFGSRKFIWLLPSYSLALYGHRCLENAIAPIIGRRYLGNSAWSQIIVGGSNFGELLGAAYILFSTNRVKTPMPWLRIDALVLLIVWYLAYWYPPAEDVKYAWMVAATFIPISFGWAAGDVSLAAYIQALLARQERNYKNVSPLSAVMAFLYCSYVVLYAIMSPMLGKYVDHVYYQYKDVHLAIQNTGGIQLTIVAAIVFAATFIPRGSWALNPKMLSDEDVEGDIDEEMAAGVRTQETNVRSSDILGGLGKHAAQASEEMVRVVTEETNVGSADSRSLENWEKNAA